MTIEERLQKNIQRLEARKQENIKRYQKTEFKKYIAWLVLVGIQCLAVMALILVCIFSIWNNLFPTQDYLYFIVIYALFGNIFNMISISYAGSCIKDHKRRVALRMKIRERQITEYFDYQIRDEYERAGYVTSEDWTNM